MHKKTSQYREKSFKPRREKTARFAPKKWGEPPCTRSTDLRGNPGEEDDLEAIHVKFSLEGPARRFAKRRLLSNNGMKIKTKSYTEGPIRTFHREKGSPPIRNMGREAEREFWFPGKAIAHEKGKKH